MLFCFERGGHEVRVQIVKATGGTFELRVLDSDGIECIERFDNVRELVIRHDGVLQLLRKQGWLQAA